MTRISRYQHELAILYSEYWELGHGEYEELDEMREVLESYTDSPDIAAEDTRISEMSSTESLSLSNQDFSADDSSLEVTLLENDMIEIEKQELAQMRAREIARQRQDDYLKHCRNWELKVALNDTRSDSDLGVDVDPSGRGIVVDNHPIECELVEDETFPGFIKTEFELIKEICNLPDAPQDLYQSISNQQTVAPFLSTLLLGNELQFVTDSSDADADADVNHIFLQASPASRYSGRRDYRFNAVGKSDELWAFDQSNQMVQDWSIPYSFSDYSHKDTQIFWKQGMGSKILCSQH